MGKKGYNDVNCTVKFIGSRNCDVIKKFNFSDGVVIFWNGVITLKIVYNKIVSLAFST